MNKFSGGFFAAALMLPVGLPIGLAAAPAGAAAAGTACKTVSGTATFSPALPKIGVTTKVVSTVSAKAAKIGGCVGGGVTSGTVALTARFTKPGNCSTLASASNSNPTKGKEVISWDNKQTSTIAITLTGVNGKPTQSAVAGTVTAGLFKGMKQTGTLNYTPPAGACTKTGLSVVTFKQVTGQAIRPAGAAVVGTLCKTVSGAAKFSPALPKVGTATKVLATVSVAGAKIGGCVGGGVTSGTLKVTAKFTKPANCASLATGGTSSVAKGTEVITWNNKKTSTIAVTLTGVKGKPTQSKITGTITAGLFKGTHQAGTVNYTIPKGGCTTTGLTAVTFKQVTTQVIK